MPQRLLARLNVVSMPGLQSGRLQSAAVRKAKLPGDTADLIHQVQMLRGEHIALSSGEKYDPGHGGRDHAAQAPQRSLRHLAGAGLLRAILPGSDHV